MFPFIPFNQGGHDQNLQQAMLFNPNLANLNTQMANLNGNNNNLNNFHGLNPYLQPMNNQLGAVFPQQQLMALQLQGLNMLNQLQSQGLLLGQNPVPGLQNQLMQGNPIMGFGGNNHWMVPNNASAGFSNANQQQVYHAKVDSKNSSVILQNFANGSSTKKFPGFVKGESSHKRFQKFQSRDTRNPKGKSRQFNRNGRRGENNQRGSKLHSVTSGEEAPTLRPRFTINYSKNEIHQWCEARKKNFPTRANVDKKLASGSKSNKDAGGDKELRCQQLKEVLAKQAELGVEVAEIPPSYFHEPGERVNNIEKQQWCEARKKNFPTRANIDKQLKEISAKQAELGAACLREPERQVHDMNNNVDDGEVNKRKVVDVNGPSPDKYNNKRRWHAGQKFKRKDWQKFKNKDAMASSSIVKREPSLLQKLLSADIKGDKNRLLQVFRFMALNDFFKHWPEKPLEFPVITLKGDVECASEVSVGGSLSLNGVDSAAVGIFKNELSGNTDGQKASDEADGVQNKFGKDDKHFTSDDEEEEGNRHVENEDGCVEQDESSEEGEIDD